MEFDNENYEPKSTSDYWSDVVRGIEEFVYEDDEDYLDDDE